MQDSQGQVKAYFILRSLISAALSTNDIEGTGVDLEEVEQV